MTLDQIKFEPIFTTEIHSEYQRRWGGGGGEGGKEGEGGEHKVDRGEGEGRRENLGERRRRKKRDGNMENGEKVREMGKWNGEDYKVVINIIWKGGRERN